MIREEETFNIISAAMKVHTALGYGFYERVYQDTLEVEFRACSIPYEREKAIAITYRDTPLGAPSFADFLCYDDVIVELKAIKRISKVEEAQVFHDLRATKKHQVLLLNFGQPHPQLIRYVNGYIETLSSTDLSGRQPANDPPESV